MSAEPFSDSPKERADKREAERRALVKAYKATFASAHGQRVLVDLKQRFGFDVCEADSELLSDNIIARRSFAKRPIYHIERMLKATLRKEPKPPRASSGNHHEPPPA